jgi:hypothetical protein
MCVRRYVCVCACACACACARVRARVCYIIPCRKYVQKSPCACEISKGKGCIFQSPHRPQSTRSAHETAPHLGPVNIQQELQTRHQADCQVCSISDMQRFPECVFLRRTSCSGTCRESCRKASMGNLTSWNLHHEMRSCTRRTGRRAATISGARSHSLSP